MHENSNAKKNYEKVLVLKDEHVADDIIEENNSNEETYIEEVNNLEELENNYIYINEDLKSKNIKQDEKIKDLNTLLDAFRSGKRYSDLDDKIKLYQEDISVERKKILDLNDKKDEDIKQLNSEILTLKQKNIQLEEELSILKKEKDSYSKNIDEKIKFYREENAKIIFKLMIFF